MEMSIIFQLIMIVLVLMIFLDIYKHLMKKKISIMFRLSILIRKKNLQIKLKRSRQVSIWTFG